MPELRLPFYRVGIFSNVAASMAPPGCASLYVELADRAPIADQQGLIADALRGLVEIAAIGAVDQVLFADLREIDPAYVVFDDRYQEARSLLVRFLEARRIFATGRYGGWVYNAMEDSLLLGKQVAGRVDALDNDAGAARASGR